MDCLDAKQKLEPCARGELSPRDRAELDQHVATCEGCRLELELTRAVLGSSSTGASVDDPLLEDPVLGNPDPADPPPSFSPEPSIEQERIPPPPADGPGPPRVLTSQLPEDAEDTLDLASIQPTNAYDPGAIDLPHTAPSSHSGGDPGPVADDPSEEKISFGDLSMDSPVMTSAPKTPSESGAAATSGAGKSWDFEPVDVPRASAPPEESLMFAKEALDRKRGNALRNRKGARLLLWMGGAVGGVGLLGASVWMALAFRDPPVGLDPANVPAVQPPPGTEIAPPAASDSLAPDPGAAASGTATDSVSSPGPVPAPLKAGAAGTGAIAPEIAPPKVPPVKLSPTKTTDPARASGTPTASTTSNATENGKTGKPAPSPAPPEFRADELAPAPRREPKILTVEPDAAPGSEPVDEPEPPASDAKPSKPVSSAPIFVPPGSDTKSPGGAAAKQPAQDPASSGPIGRLHLATVTAEKNGDLDALRKLKDSWKSMIRSTTGADRARSKREYADCLWAIQEITGRDADRKEALAAYRDYVLYAPAGGADARTVSRMRQLEDFLSDPR